MPIKKVAHKEKMTKKKSGSTVTKWVPFEFEESNLNKANREGFLAGAAPIVFPGTECIPKPPSGCRVIFLLFSSMVFLFLPMNFFVGFFSFMACSFTSSPRIQSCISPVLSPSVSPSLESTPIGFFGSFFSASALVFH
jgi:hypothetical protein